ncbi:hypothetical protein DDZ16_03240 [Marinilabilia rubra]|uniref:Uncharacterized protein n=1 Tax=Marinilabilia rubra TaxID=2162893 RepID=A0A2U2BC32_9BACT|nr:hypothetical protein DDZ16_03240 [Marinilabilia rubra]
MEMRGCSHKNALCFSRRGGDGLADFFELRDGRLFDGLKTAKPGGNVPMQNGSKNVTVQHHEGMGRGRWQKDRASPEWMGYY